MHLAVKMDGSNDVWERQAWHLHQQKSWWVKMNMLKLESLEPAGLQDVSEEETNNVVTLLLLSLFLLWWFWLVLVLLLLLLLSLSSSCRGGDGVDVVDAAFPMIIVD